MVGRVGVSTTESKSGGGGSGGSSPSMLSSSPSNFGGFGSGLRVASSGGTLFSDDLEEDKSSKEYEMIWSYVDYCFFFVVVIIILFILILFRVVFLSLARCESVCAHPLLSTFLFFYSFFFLFILYFFFLFFLFFFLSRYCGMHLFGIDETRLLTRLKNDERIQDEGRR